MIMKWGIIMGYDDTYLMHHGVKGMHWGVRRFRNYDGTLTSAGKAQRRAQSSGSSGGGGGGRRGMSSQTKKRLATAAKVAGAAAAVGGAAYLANRASGGKLTNAARLVGDTVSDRTADARGRFANTKAGKALDNYRAQGGLKSTASGLASGARTKVGNAARRVGDTVSDRTADARNRFANTRAGKALDNYRAQGGLRSKISDARTKASNKFNALAQKGQETLDKRKYGNTKSSLARSAKDLKLTRGERARQTMGRAKDSASNALGNARTKVSGLASTARTKVGNAARRVGDNVSDRTADARNRFANTRAGKALDNYRAQGGLRSKISDARTKASNKFNALAQKGQETLDKRKYGNTKSSLARSAKDLKLTRGERARKTIGRAKDSASNALGNARTKVSGLASTARTKTGNAARRVGDTVSDRTADARNRFANTRAGKALDNYRAQGGVRSTVKSAASGARTKVSSLASTARTKTGNAARRVGDTVSDRTADARNRFANTRAGKAIDNYRAQGGVRSTVKSAASATKSRASYLKSRVGGGVVNTRSKKRRR